MPFCPETCLPGPMFLRGLALALALLVAGAGRAETEATARPEVARPLQAAQEALKAGKTAEAQARVREAEALPGSSPYEAYLIQRSKGAVAMAAKDYAAALSAFEAVMGSTQRMALAEQTAMLQALPGVALRAQQPAAAVRWARHVLKDIGPDRPTQLLLVQALYNLGDFAASLAEALPLLQADEAAGRKPVLDLLNLVANCQLKTQDEAGYALTLERLLTHHPKPEYWADLLPRLQRKPGYDAKLDIDLLRLMRRAGALLDADEYIDMAQQLLKAGAPAEALAVLDEGAAKGVGQGAAAAQHRSLIDSARKQAAADAAQFAADEARARSAADGVPLFRLGLAMVGARRAETGLALMRAGLDKGGARLGAQARLQLGAALLMNQRRAEAEPLLRGLPAADGTADLGRLWLLLMR
jgi:hypothetical protein